MRTWLPTLAGIVAGLVSGFAAVTFYSLRPSATTAHATDAVPAATPASGDAELRAELAQVRQRVAVLDARASASAAAAPTDDPEPDGEAKRVALVSGLRSRLAGETPDPGWAQATERALSDEVAALPLDVAIDHVECGASLCRTELSCNDAQTLRRLPDAQLDGTVVASMETIFDYDDADRRVEMFSLRQPR